ncbi:RES family NAD+ phosphorylase [Jannaschia sp. R86511]|uniref:RES family NAD+ phosphorylase n=1 Tax=Jannaschia sp. R86511 TaxID=3093853 RepID=UPI0036D36E9A
MPPGETADPPQTGLGEAERHVPVVTQGSGPWCRVSGHFHRAVDSANRSRALGGSRLPGRYSAAGQPTLYLSSSPEGVAAAMLAHGGARGHLTVLAFEVHAEDIVALRDPAALASGGVDLEDAVAPWQDLVVAGGVPRSWGVRQRLEHLGVQGLIDPSRTRPGLWHLVLFRWNIDGAARVVPLRP